MKRIAVDWDGTCVKLANYPEMGENVPNAFETIKRLVASGHEVIIWTVRDNHIFIIERLKKQSLENLKINSLVHQSLYSYSPKMDADVYIDDKALNCPLIETTGKPYVDWYEVEWLLEEQGYFKYLMGASSLE